MQTPRKKDRLRLLWLGAGFGMIGLAVLLSLGPEFPIDLPLEAEDKVFHVLGYGGVMWWFSQAYPSPRSQMVLAAVLLMLGFGLEAIQSFHPIRSLTYGDIAANIVGVALGWLCAPPRLPNILEGLRAARG